MASIRPKGNKFEVRVCIQGKALSRTFPTAEEAKRWAVGIQYGFVAPTKARTGTSAIPTLSEACDRYVEEVVIHHKGARQERNRLRVIQRLKFAGVRIDKISSEQIREYRDQMQVRGLSDSSIRLALALLSSLFRHARQEWGLNLENPVKGVKKPKPGKARTRRLDGDEEDRLMSALSSCRNPWVIRVVRICLETGMRRSEVLSLTWNRIDLDKRIISLQDTKNGHPRWVPLTQTAYDLLAELHRTGGVVFPISESALTQAWGHALRRAGINDLRLHDLRHEALSRWAHRLNGDVFKLSLISGHRTLQMAQRYVHPVKAELIAITQQQSERGAPQSASNPGDTPW